MTSEKDDILKALDKMEAQSEEINTRKARTEARVKKHIKPKVEISREEMLKQKKKDLELQEGWSFRNKVYLAAAGGISFLGIAYIKARGDKMDFVFYIIAGIIFIGFYLMARNSRR